ncbi:DMT family transporter [Natronocalculus amylovorans]|uniref:DMT family transporter n=1 Tax=Natronocalculus amylovorans TaxID=2917812 RepID=A0AAE3K8I4_9EURY|nr:DMT family transporter [Natronocalculus amylovorans]MCL9816535.1 DMT family transporter [Natronocalculus amylovorans]NUE00981.1 EamA family transporter [Halorubraceae archaeon YAN]
MDSGLGFALTAAVVWGVYIFILKRSFEGYPAAALTVLVNTFAILWYLPITATRTDFSDGVFAGFGTEQVGIILLTGVMTAAAFVLFLRAIADGDVSYVTPINKIVPVFVLPLEVVILGQFLTPLQVTGVVVATLAVYVANYEPGGFFQPFIKAAKSRPAQLALLSAMCYAVSDLGKRVGLQELAIQGSLWVPLLLFTAALVLLPSAIRNPPADLRGDLPKLAGAGALVALGEHVTTLAFALLPASIASPVINTQAIVAVVLGGVLLGERYFRLRLVAAVLAVVGVTLIAI